MTTYIVFPDPPTVTYAGGQVDLQDMLHRLRTDPHLARFIRGQLRLAHSSDPATAAAAQAVLANYYMPANDELDEMGLPVPPVPPVPPNVALKCTEHGALIAAVAHNIVT